MPVSIKSFVISFVTAALLTVAALEGLCQQEDNFVFTQLKYEGAWDPYPETWQDILQFLVVTTSIKCEPERRVLTLDDKLLFSSPFLVILGTENFPVFSRAQREALRRYMSSGGLIFVENSSGVRGGAFDISFRKEAAALIPEASLKKLPADHPLYRAYYFIRKVGGRRLTSDHIEGLDIGGRTALVYSQNDLIGAWAKDRLGNYLWECVPGKEQQRFEAQKLMLNIIMYSVTGTYKSDAIHKPYLEMKNR